MSQKKYFIGSDPGWTNLGWSIISEDLSEVVTGFCVPRDLPPGSTPLVLLEELRERNINPMQQVAFGAMERFVYYKGVHNPNSEQILMVTGQLQFMFHQFGTPVKLFRAAEWKQILIKHLYKTQGFRNPSDRLDKEFSLAAAHAISGIHFETDHEADAFCLAYMAKLAYDYNNQRQ